jgi:hypothetical protein
MTQPQSDRPQTTTDGFVLLGNDATDAQQVKPPSQSPQLDEEEVSDFDIPVPERVLLLDALFTELEPASPEQVVLALSGSAAVRLAGRAGFLGMLRPEVASDVELERDWQRLLGTGMSAAQLALLIRAEPWLPPAHMGVPFSSWLVSQAVLSQDQLDELAARSIDVGWPIFQVALDDGALDERRYVEQLAAFSGLELAQSPAGLSRAVLVGFPLGWVEYFELVPIERVDGRFVVAVPTVLPDALVRCLEADLGCEVELRLAPPAAVSAWRRRWQRAWRQVHQVGSRGLGEG